MKYGAEVKLSKVGRNTVASIVVELMEKTIG